MHKRLHLKHADIRDHSPATDMLNRSDNRLLLAAEDIMVATTEGMTEVMIDVAVVGVQVQGWYWQEVCLEACYWEK